MAIDKELAELMGLKPGRPSGDWLDRLMVEVVEPFDLILRGHHEQFERRLERGFTTELIEDTHAFNKGIENTIGMMLVLFTISNVPMSIDPEGTITRLGIKLLAERASSHAIGMYREAKVMGKEERGKEG